MRVTVRDAVPSDAAAMGRIKRDAWQAAYRGLLPAEVLESIDADQLATNFGVQIRASNTQRRPELACLVAAAARHVIGYVTLGPYRLADLAGAGEVYALYVDPPHWGAGAGRALLLSAEVRLRTMGHDEAALWVLETNQLGRGFYEAVGWHPDGVTGEYCEFEGAVEARFRRSLTP